MSPTLDEEYYVIDGYERYYSNIDLDYNRKFKNPSKFYNTRAKYDLTLINLSLIHIFSSPFNFMSAAMLWIKI